MELPEKLAFGKDVRISSRRIKRMEGAGAGAGEVRKIHIIYFISRLGHVEHPHLIRVHHLTRNGVYLRDVKRWLAEMRGKDMPESFSWSYKRRYKIGYVWQDLLDDDLITPISDNEYVLKGSESLPPLDEKKVGMLRNIDEPAAVEVAGDQEQVRPSSFFPKEEEIQDPTPRSSQSQKSTSPQIFRESPVYAYASVSSERSTLTDDSMKHELEDANNDSNNNNNIKPTLTQISKDNSDSSSSPFFYSGLFNKKKSNSIHKNKKTENKDIQKMATTTTSTMPSSSSQFAKSRSCSNGASNILRNLMKCGAVDTNDAVVVNRNSLKTCLSNSINLPVSNTNHSNTQGRDREKALNMICQGDQLGGSTRIFGTTWNNQHQRQQQYRARKSFDGTSTTTASKRKNEFASSKSVSSAYSYRPVGGPTCSQCGKLFNPEKFHKHMKSCKGVKALSKTIPAAASVSCSEKTPPQRSMNLPPHPQESTSNCLLTN